MTATNSVCECGHPAESHGHVPGFDMSPGVAFTVNDDPTQHTRMPDVWVCEGDPATQEQMAAIERDELSPWDLVCGCVLHSDPRPA